MPKHAHNGHNNVPRSQERFMPNRSGITRSGKNILLDLNPNAMLQMKANGPYTPDPLYDFAEYNQTVCNRLCAIQKVKEARVKGDNVTEIEPFQQEKPISQITNASYDNNLLATQSDTAGRSSLRRNDSANAVGSDAIATKTYVATIVPAVRHNAHALLDESAMETTESDCEEKIIPILHAQYIKVSTKCNSHQYDTIHTDLRLSKHVIYNSLVETDDAELDRPLS